METVEVLASEERLRLLRLLMRGPATLTQLVDSVGRYPAWILREDPEAPDVVTVAMGSLESLIALRHGLGQVAGCHLLDPATGDFNRSYARALFPGRELTLITLAHRQQPRGTLRPRDADVRLRERPARRAARSAGQGPLQAGCPRARRVLDARDRARRRAFDLADRRGGVGRRPARPHPGEQHERDHAPGRQVQEGRPSATPPSTAGRRPRWRRAGRCSAPRRACRRRCRGSRAGRAPRRRCAARSRPGRCRPRQRRRPARAGRLAARRRRSPGRRRRSRRRRRGAPATRSSGRRGARRGC